MTTNEATKVHPLAWTIRQLAGGAWVTLDERGHATFDLDEPDWDEGPTCPICDGLGHGVPGTPRCPIEEPGFWDLGEGERF